MCAFRINPSARPLAAVGLSAFLALLGSAQAEVRRCEDSSGHVTYSNQPCPSGTAHERPVEQRPPVEVPREPSGEKATHAGVIRRAEPGQASATASEDQGREQNKAQVARCDDLVRRIEFAQQDELSAAASERASIELNVRRLQEEYESSCGKH